jgi:eukaryotic-like serine/threonine-protein kinase
MTPARWRQIEDLYNAARGRDAGERAALLSSVDGDLRREVERLLDQPSSGTPLDSPAWEGMSSGALPQPVPRPEIGSQIGPYRIEARIGAGGMGAVYRAVDGRLRRTVAIKFPNEPFDGRFEREARSIAALNHPNICTVHDVGPNYLVMELVEGPTLAELIAKGPLPMEEAIAIARQIADALDAAHERGIIHRDLKPANIKIKPDGAVKVLDFGLARTAPNAALTGEEAPTHTLTITEEGTLAGTPSYMAPERALGKPIDKRADIWAFGVVVYEMLTGKPLFPGKTTAEILHGVLTLEPDWERVPPAARRLLKRCLSAIPIAVCATSAMRNSNWRRFRRTVRRRAGGGGFGRSLGCCSSRLWRHFGRRGERHRLRGRRS